MARHSKHGLTKEDSKVLAVRVTQFDSDAVSLFAEHFGISRSNVIRWAIAEFQERYTGSLLESQKRKRL